MYIYRCIAIYRANPTYISISVYLFIGGLTLGPGPGSSLSHVDAGQCVYSTHWYPAPSNLLKEVSDIWNFA